MIMKGKVQTNDFGNNILVETEFSSNMHISHLDRSVTVTRIFSDEEAITEGQDIFNSLPVKDKAQIFKDLLRQRKGYATSNCKRCETKYPNSQDLNYGNLVKYEEK